MVHLSEISQDESFYVHDVFLSFRGADTRNSFTDHLHKALLDANIDTFLDDAEMKTGQELKTELVSAIKTSKASIIVLSRNYASSTWCLDELALIMEQHRTSKHVVFPIFYHVEPTDVRKQQKSFLVAMEEHKQKMEAETDAHKKSERAQKIDKWKKALTQVSDLKGIDANDKRETILIEGIVKEVHNRLDLQKRSNIPRLIGMESIVREITSFLKNGSSNNTAHILTIWGMAGIGKTCLADYIFKLHYHDFERSCFLEDIERRCREPDGLLDLQKKLLKDIQDGSWMDINNTDVGTFKIEKSLLRKKTLLVLDSVDNLEQLDVLIGTKGLHPGSKIIITSKNGSLTEKCRLFQTQVPPTHSKHFLKGLNEKESLQLLSWHAFGCNEPKEDEKNGSMKVVKYCRGHPLAIKVLGSSVRNEDATMEDILESLGKEINPDIKKVLRISFDSLPYEKDKELFKHIACFFVGGDKKLTEEILRACGICKSSGIMILINRSLLTLVSNKLVMHQLLQDMGRDLVLQESPKKPWKRSLLWNHEECLDVLQNGKGTTRIKGLILDMNKYENETFSSGSLRWLCMHGFPLSYIPSDLPMENMVALDMSNSKLQQLWKEPKLLRSLKFLNLKSCFELVSVGPFSGLPALENLMLERCTSLVEVCESIGTYCGRLEVLDMSECKKLKKLPNSIGKLKNLTKLVLDGCSNLAEFPVEMMDMESLKVLMADKVNKVYPASSSAIVKAIPRTLKTFQIFLPHSLVSLSLRNNNLYSESFPNDFSSLAMLKYLHLDDNPIESLPDCVRSLSRLEDISFARCRRLKTVLGAPSKIKYLLITDCFSLEKVTFHQDMSALPCITYFRGECLTEIEGKFKQQALTEISEEILCSFGLTN
ncbi:disease resistance protein RML1A-like protein isoform X1 [Tanacetum coccineum]